MKKYLILMSCIICVFLCNTMSHAALFTFDELDPLTHPTDISTYMSDIYGSEVVVKGATTCQSGDLGDDTYLTNLGKKSYFKYMSIEFAKVHITSMSFDAQLSAESSGNVVGAWFALDADETLVDSTWVYGKTYAEGLTFDFSAPVSKLFFVSSNNSHVGIDNMRVTPVPEPASILLLGFGLIGITTYSRKKFKK